MEKAAGLDADEVFFDLEDAVAPAEKEGARSLALEALRTHAFGRTARALRVNDLSTRWAERDLADAIVAGADALEAVIVPKVEDAAQVERLDELLARVERDTGRRLELELQIESALGLVNLREITRASTRLSAVIFGPGDFAASMGIPQDALGTSDPRYPGHQWHWAMAQIAVHARAAGAQAIDGPWADFNDEEGFRRSATWSRLLGFDGKWCIHPNQIPWANDVFAPTEEEIAGAEVTIEAYSASVAAGKGAAALDGKLIDEASRKIAEATLDRARAAGLR